MVEKSEIPIENDMGVTLTLALGAISSYVAGNIPTIRELYIGTNIKEKLDAYYRLAIDKWNVSLPRKDAARNNMEKHFEQLQDYILHPAAGKHPEEKELLRLWAEYVLTDADCCTFIMYNQQALFHNQEFEALTIAQNLLSEILADQKEAFLKIDEDLDRLLKRGSETGLSFWQRKSHADNIALPYSTILAGREVKRLKVLSIIHTPSALFIEADSQQEAMAFAAASILSSDDEFAAQRTIVVTNADLFKEIEKERNDYIIITPLSENPWVAVQNGHSVIRCMSKAERGVMDGKIVLGMLDREQFIQSLKQAGLNDDYARRLAIDVSLDINFLWRNLKIETSNLTWADEHHVRTLIPAMLVGKWDESCKNDKELIAMLYGGSYEEYFDKLQFIINAEESPLLKIGSTWVVKAPYTIYNIFYKDITNQDLNRYVECLDWLLEDDDPDVLAKIEKQQLRLWQNRRAYSSYIREGMLQSLALLSLVFERNNRKCDIIHKSIQKQLAEFTQERYFSNMHNMKWIAEADPAAFLHFVHADILHEAKLMNRVFEIKKNPYGLTDTNIYYSSLLFCLENIAWDEKLLAQTTDILCYLCNYRNDSNWTNRPINSLYSIYNLLLPQTFADFDTRYGNLKSLSKKYPSVIYALCIKLLEGIDNCSALIPTPHFQWRWAERYVSKEDETVCRIQILHIRQLLSLAFDLCNWSKEELAQFLELSSKPFVGMERSIIFDAIDNHIKILRNDEQFIKSVRKIINQHTACSDAPWAMSANELQCYQDLLAKIEPQDIITQTKPFFENTYFNLKSLGLKFDDIKGGVDKTIQLRAQKLELVYEQLGLDGIWTLLAEANSPEAVAEGFWGWTKETYASLVYHKYCNGEVPVQFVRKYFLLLYFKIGADAYMNLVREFTAADETKIGIVLYAPEYKPELADFAESKSQELLREYWNNVVIGFMADDQVTKVMHRLWDVKRYDDILTHFCDEGRLRLISNEDKIELLCTIFNDSDLGALSRCCIQVSEFLRSIELSDSIPQKQTILLIELVLFNNLRHYLQGNAMHLLREVNDNPDYLLQLLMFNFIPDGGIEELEKMNDEERRMHKFIYPLVTDFWYNYHYVPCTRDDGTIDEIRLEEYISELKRLAPQYHLANSVADIIGKILGNIPEGDNYPSDTMCRIVNSLDDDAVDRAIGTRLFNKLGVTSRSVFDGGIIEEQLVKKYTEYKNRAQLRSWRLAAIFDTLAQDYSSTKDDEDESAMHNRLHM